MIINNGNWYKSKGAFLITCAIQKFLPLLILNSLFSYVCSLLFFSLNSSLFFLLKKLSNAFSKVIHQEVRLAADNLSRKVILFLSSDTVGLKYFLLPVLPKLQTTFIFYKTDLPSSGPDCFHILLISDLATAKAMHLMQSEIEGKNFKL